MARVIARRRIHPTAQSLLFAASGRANTEPADPSGLPRKRPTTAAPLRLVITSTNCVPPGVAGIAGVLDAVSQSAM
jgi:hypothetical protein